MKHSKCLLTSALLGSAYLAYIITYIYNNLSCDDAFEALGAGLATAMLTPHLICVAIAVVFNWLGFSGNIRWAALTGGIMYAVGGVLWLMYAPFVVPSMVFSFVGFANLKNLPADSGKNLAYAHKCVYCGAVRERGEIFNRYGFCEDCRDEVSSKVRGHLEKLQSACTMLNPELLQPDQYATALTEIDQHINTICQLEQLRPRVPMFKSSTREYESQLLAHRAQICAKLGIENTPPHLPNRGGADQDKSQPINLTSLSATAAKSNRSAIWITGLSILCILILYCYGDARQQIDDLADQLAAANTIISGQSDQIDKLQAMVAGTDPAPQQTYRLSSGYYTAGKDFLAGTYDIEAVKGHGNVSSDNMYSGGINAVMSEKSKEGFYEQKYSNISLPEDTQLHIDGVTVKLTLIK